MIGIEFAEERERKRARTVPLGDGGWCEISLDRTFELLANRCRRDAIAVLIGDGGPTTLEELADELRRQYADRSSDDRPASVRRGVATELHHRHLPRLDASDLIDYDPTTGEITAIRTADTLVRIEGTDPEETCSFECVFEKIIGALSGDGVRTGDGV